MITMTPQQQNRMIRDEKILCCLEELNFATRKQLQTILRLGGDRNAQRILARLEKDDAIRSLRRASKVYYLSNRGKQRIGSNQPELKRDKIKHTLMCNDAYIELGMPANWRQELPLQWDGNKLIPDAVYVENGVYHFVEIDNTQTMRTNFEKIHKYAELSSVIESEYGRKPRLIWRTVSEVRKRKLSAECEKHRIDYVVT